MCHRIQRAPPKSMSEPEIAPSADAAAAADADDTTLATTAVNSEGDDFGTHVEKLIHSKKTETGI